MKTIVISEKLGFAENNLVQMSSVGTEKVIKVESTYVFIKLQHIKFSFIPKTFFPDLFNHILNSPHLTEDEILILIGKLVKTLQRLQKTETEPSADRRRPNSPVNNLAPTPAIPGEIKQALEVMTDDMNSGRFGFMDSLSAFKLS